MPSSEAGVSFALPPKADLIADMPVRRRRAGFVAEVC